MEGLEALASKFGDDVRELNQGELKDMAGLLSMSAKSTKEMVKAYRDMQGNPAARMAMQMIAPKFMGRVEARRNQGESMMDAVAASRMARGGAPPG